MKCTTPWFLNTFKKLCLPHWFMNSHMVSVQLLWFKNVKFLSVDTVTSSWMYLLPFATGMKFYLLFLWKLVFNLLDTQSLLCGSTFFFLGFSYWSLFFFFWVCLQWPSQFGSNSFFIPVFPSPCGTNLFSWGLWLLLTTFTKWLFELT